MKPKLKDAIAWQQAELLMQPALIRVIDNISKHLERSSWQGDYREEQFPYPTYKLVLKLGDRTLEIDLWELCYQVCFLEYHLTHAKPQTQEVDIDTSLIAENGEVNWQRLDEKSKTVVQTAFKNLGQE